MLQLYYITTEGSAFGEINNKIYTINENGEKAEFKGPYSDDYYFELLENCAVLNNNGYIYVADKEGNTILSEEGYTKYKYTSNDGLIELISPDGSVQVIDSYGNEVVPFGNDYSVAVLTNGEGKEIEEYSLLYDRTDDEYIFIDNENHHIMETNKKLSNDFAEQLFNGQGWIVWNESANTLFAVVSDEKAYRVSGAARLIGQ